VGEPLKRSVVLLPSDPKRDVVPTLSDVGGSSFLLTRSDVHEMVDDCVLRGERQYDRAVMLLESQKKVFLLERDTLDKQIANLEQLVNEKTLRLDEVKIRLDELQFFNYIG
jgi:hypothetical protein